MIGGVDEVGRGCWAGPVVAGAVVLKRPIKGLRDSKKLTKLQRQKLAETIKDKALAWSLGWADAKEVDAFGLTAAVSLAMHRAMATLPECYDQIVVDGNYNFLADMPGSSTLIKADDLVPAVSAASILAKVARDEWMATEAAQRFPLYGFEKHVGYGTAAHILALETHGICDLHRLSFRPVRAMLQA